MPQCAVLSLRRRWLCSLADQSWAFFDLAAAFQPAVWGGPRGGSEAAGEVGSPGLSAVAEQPSDQGHGDHDAGLAGCGAPGTAAEPATAGTGEGQGGHTEVSGEAGGRASLEHSSTGHEHSKLLPGVSSEAAA